MIEKFKDNSETEEAMDQGKNTLELGAVIQRSHIFLGGEGKPQNSTLWSGRAQQSNITGILRFLITDS